MTAAKNSPKAVKETTVRKYGGSLGVTLPKGMMEQFGMVEGDTVQIRQTGDGILITPYDEEFERAMEAAQRISKRYQNAFRELAK
jgi:putative addiction module antidote